MIQDLLPLLESPHFADRTRGLELLSSLETPEDILKIHDYVEINDSDSLRLALQKLLFRLLKRDREDLCGLALSILLTQAGKSAKHIRQESEKLIDEFLSSPQTFQYLKFLAIKKAWKTLGEEERLLATKKIGSYQLTEVLSLLIDNFKTTNSKLLITTMEVFRRMNDRRANRFIRITLDESQDPEVLLKSLQVLSHLGYFLDQKYFLRFSKHTSEAVRLAAIEGLFVLRGAKALPVVKEFFKASPSMTSKTKVIELLSRYPTAKGVTALMELWQDENFSEVEHKIEWALNELEGPEKLDAILNFYPRATEVVELKILSLLNEIHHPKCYAFYLSVIRENKNEFLTMSAIEAVSYYNDQRTIPLLESILKNPESMLHYYALGAYLKHSQVDLSRVIESIVDLNFEEDRHYHQLLLNVLREQNSIRTLSVKMREYVFRMLSSQQRDNRYLAYSVVDRFAQEFDLDKVFSTFSAEKNELVLKEGYQVFASIFSRLPMEFVASSPPEDIFTQTHFVQRLKPTLEVVDTLFKHDQRELLHRLQEKPSFWPILFSYLQATVLDFKQLCWINLTKISFEEFTVLWGIYKKDLEISVYLLMTISIRRDQRFGDFLLAEYLTHRNKDIYPFVSRYVNGLP